MIMNANIGPGSYKIDPDSICNRLRKKVTRQEMVQQIRVACDLPAPSRKSSSMDFRKTQKTGEIDLSHKRNLMMRTFNSSTGPGGTVLDLDYAKQMQRMRTSFQTASRDERLNLASNMTNQEIGPGAYELNQGSISAKLERKIEERSHSRVKNKYLNKVFPPPKDLRCSTLPNPTSASAAASAALSRENSQHLSTYRSKTVVTFTTPIKEMSSKKRIPEYQAEENY